MVEDQIHKVVLRTTPDILRQVTEDILAVYENTEMVVTGHWKDLDVAPEVPAVMTDLVRVVTESQFFRGWVTELTGLHIANMTETRENTKFWRNLEQAARKA